MFPSYFCIPLMLTAHAWQHTERVAYEWENGRISLHINIDSFHSSCGSRQLSTSHCAYRKSKHSSVEECVEPEPVLF